MKTFRLVATALLVVLCTGFYSCGGDNEEQPLYDTLQSALCKQYGITDYEEIEALWINEGSEQVEFLGLRNSHLWLASFDTDTKQKLVEWTDTKEFNNRERRIDLGYGEYKDITFTRIFGRIYNTSNNNFIAVLNYLFGSNFNSLTERYAVFKNGSSTKKVSLEGIKSYANYKGYEDSYFIGDCCYTQTGDTIYVVQKLINQYDFLSSAFVSYEEEVSVSYDKGFSVLRYNYKTGEDIWNVAIGDLADVPSDAKMSVTTLDSSTNIWKYKVDLLYYDGTKRDYTFSINIVNGEIQ